MTDKPLRNALARAIHAPAAKRARGLLVRIRRQLGIAVGVVALLALLGAVIAYLPPMVLGVNQVSKVASLAAVDQVKAVSDLRTAFLQVLAGIGIAATVYFSARTLQLNRRGQVTDRFTKAIEQIGSDALDVRLGGIYALEQIASDSSELHGPVMEILTAFLREHARASDGGREPYPPARADFQAVATVLGRRKFEHDVPGQHLDLRGVALASCNFTGAHLEGADFTDAYLEGADFTDADLHRDADLRWADFTAAHLEGAYFASAHVEGATFTGVDGLILAQLEEAHGFNEAICSYYWTPDQKQVQTRR